MPNTTNNKNSCIASCTNNTGDNEDKKGSGQNTEKSGANSKLQRKNTTIPPDSTDKRSVGSKIVPNATKTLQTSTAKRPNFINKPYNATASSNKKPKAKPKPSVDASKTIGT